MITCPLLGKISNLSSESESSMSSKLIYKLIDCSYVNFQAYEADTTLLGTSKNFALGN
jgi:hypothetical protein